MNDEEISDSEATIAFNGWLLIVHKPNGQEIGRFHLSVGANVIGRSETAQISVEVIPGLSRIHCSITVPIDPTQPVVLRDLSSTNGTRVNGEKIAPETDVPLSPEDIVSITGMRLLICPPERS